jgi:hypothetical protein
MNAAMWKKEYFHVPLYAWAAGGLALVVALFYFSRKSGSGLLGSKQQQGAGIPGGGAGTGGGAPFPTGGGAPLPYPTGPGAGNPVTPSPTAVSGQPQFAPASPIPVLTPTSGVSGLSAAVQAALQAASQGTGPPMVVSTPQSQFPQWTVQPGLAPAAGPLPLVGSSQGQASTGISPAWLNPIQPGAAFIPASQPNASMTGAPSSQYLPMTASTGPVGASGIGSSPAGR